jgi:protoheme IX farnesyltransferase
MSSISSANQAMVVSRPAGKRGLLAMYLELSKARLSSLVVLTTAVGYVMATPAGGVINWKRLLVTVVGTALAAACANAFNQVVETRRDGLMERTRRRPLPSGSLGARHATLFALATGYAGIGTLAYAVSVDAAMLALLTILLYIGVYTPLKTRSPLNTLAGAVCGAIPPMIGWEAAAGTLGPGAWILAGVLFAWQLPHFFALAWRYREDYARGGFAMLSVRDRWPPWRRAAPLCRSRWGRRGGMSAAGSTPPAASSSAAAWWPSPSASGSGDPRPAPGDCSWRPWSTCRSCCA